MDYRFARTYLPTFGGSRHMAVARSHMSDRETTYRNSPRADVSASEVANYTFCAKAWHLEHVLGAAASATAEDRRISGAKAHMKHGADIRSAIQLSKGLTRGLVALLLIAVAVLVFGVLMSRQ